MPQQSKIIWSEQIEAVQTTMIISLQDKPKEMTTPKDVNQLLQSLLKAEDTEDREKEHFWVLMLDARNRIKSLDLVSLGTVNRSLVHPREVFRRAIAVGCSSIILAHNHPSDISEPSVEDIAITERLVEAGKILSIDVIDHIITTGEDYYSFKEEMLL